MQTVLKHPGQVIVIAASNKGAILINHYSVVPDERFQISYDSTDLASTPLAAICIEGPGFNTGPERAGFLMRYFRQVYGFEQEAILSDLHSLAKLTVTILGEGNYVIDLTGTFIYPQVVTDEYLEHFLNLTRDDSILYVSHTTSSSLSGSSAIH